MIQHSENRTETQHISHLMPHDLGCMQTSPGLHPAFFRGCQSGEGNTFGDVQIALVEQCMARGRLKNAVQYSRALELQEQFPDLERLEREDTLQRLTKKQLWPAASRSVQGHPDLQVMPQHIRMKRLDCFCTYSFDSYVSR